MAMKNQTYSQNSLLIWIALLVCVILGATLRLYGLDSQSLWNDELESWRQSNFPTLNAVLTQGSIPDTHPPLFQITLFFVEQYLGSSETLLRLPSAIAGIISIAAMYWLGTTAFGKREGLISAFLTAVLWAPIYYSQEARNYAFLILFCILSGGFWLQIVNRIREGERFAIRVGAGYVFFALLACYTHYFGTFLVLLQGLSLLILAFAFHRNKGQIVILYVVVLIGYSPWIPFAITQFGHADLVSWIDQPEITFFPAFIAYLFNRSRPLGFLALMSYGLLLWLLLRSYSGQHSAYRLRSLLTSTEFLLAYWLIVPITIVYLLSLIGSPFLTQRNLLISLPPAYILLARAITRVFKTNYFQWALVGVFGVLPLLQMIFVMGYYHIPDKEQFREAVRYVVDMHNTEENEAVIGFAKYPDYFGYYFMRFSSDLRVDLLLDAKQDLADLDRFLVSHKKNRFWYIAGHGMPKSELIDALEERYVLLDEKTFLGAHVWKFAVAQD
jgi:mannosyltransferase